MGNPGLLVDRWSRTDSCMLRIFSVVLVLTAVLFCVSARAVTLVKDGKPVATIVIADDALAAKPAKPAGGTSSTPAAKVHLAALELQRYVEKISGATLPIASAGQPRPAGTIVLVGASPLTESLGLNIPTGLTPERKDEGLRHPCHRRHAGSGRQ